MSELQKRGVGAALKRGIVFILFTLAIYSPKAYSQSLGSTFPKPAAYARIYGGSMSASGYYNLRGEVIPSFYDSSSSPHSLVREYTAEFNQHLGGVYAEYAISDRINLVADLPVAYWQLRENYSNYDTVTIVQSGNSVRIRNTFINKEKASLSLFQPLYYGIGGRYYFDPADLMRSAVSLQLRIPPGFHRGVNNDPDYPFLSDRAFEALLGWELQIGFGKNWLGTSIQYNFRDEEFKDQILMHTEVGIASVPQTELVLSLNYTQSTSRFDPTLKFIPRAAILQENALDIGGSFKIFFTDIWFVDAMYSVRSYGVNSWSSSAFTIGTGLRFF